MRANDFVSLEMGLKETFNRKFDDLKKSPPTLEQTSQRRADCEKAITALAPEFQEAARNEVADLDPKMEEGAQRRVCRAIERRRSNSWAG